MKRILSSALALTLLLGSTEFVAADSYRNNNSSYRGSQYDQGSQYNQGRNDRNRWRQGQRVDQREYRRWEQVDYRRYHMRRPARGYEYRRAPDGRVIEIAIATGLIIAILNSH